MQVGKTSFGDEEKSFYFRHEWKSGKIQERILQTWSLVIYNIEYTQIIFKDGKEYILGSNEIPFLDTFQTSLEALEKTIDDIKIFV